MNEEFTNQIGDIKISDDVVATIIGLSVSEIKGVVSTDFVGKIGIKNKSKGIRVDISDGKVAAEIYINIRYGYNIPEICSTVQEKVISSLESMTGLTVSNVDVHVVGIDID